MNAPRNRLRTLSRRRALGLLGLLGGTALLRRPALLAGDAVGAALNGCVEPSVFFDDFDSPGSCVLVPSETQGPYPLLSVLDDPIVDRRDITEGRPGVPLRLHLKLVDLRNGCTPIPNAAVYIWQCDKDGVYSGYAQPGGVNTVGQTFCRGLQLTDCNGIVSFLTMYPGWYSGRITHIHFQVYLDDGGTLTATSQLAFPRAVTQAVYASPLYAAHGQNPIVDFSQDNVFADGVEHQLVTIDGDVASGYDATLRIAIAG